MKAGVGDEESTPWMKGWRGELRQAVLLLDPEEGWREEQQLDPQDRAPASCTAASGAVARRRRLEAVARVSAVVGWWAFGLGQRRL